MSQPLIFSKLQESWSKVSHAARDMVTVFSSTLFLVLVAVVTQMVKTPPKGKCFGTPLGAPSGPLHLEMLS